MKSHPHVCFVSSIHDLRDKRVYYKEAVTLAAAGFEVSHIAPGDADASVLEHGVRLVTYRCGVGRWGRFRHLPRLYRAAARTKADVYHCNELDSWLVGVALRVFRGVGLVFDVHEHYPSRFANGRLPSWLQPIASSLVRGMFATLVPLTDRVVLAKKSLFPDFRRFEGKVVLVQNFAPLAMEPHEGSDVGERSSAGLTAIHLGLMSRARGWPELLEGLAHFASNEIRVVILGSFIDGSEEACRERIAALHLESRVELHGWVQMAEALVATRRADVGLVLFQPGIQNHVYALPHKLFDYMLAGLPVIAPSFAVEVAEIVSDAHCGILVDVTDPADIGRALDTLRGDPDLRRRLGEAGRKAVAERYNWEREGARLVDMYRALLRRRGAQGDGRVQGSD